MLIIMISDRNALRRVRVDMINGRIIWLFHLGKAAKVSIFNAFKIARSVTQILTCCGPPRIILLRHGLIQRCSICQLRGVNKMNFIRWCCCVISLACFLMMAMMWALYANFFTYEEIKPYCWITRFFMYVFLFRVIMGLWWFATWNRILRRNCMITAVCVYAAVMALCLVMTASACVYNVYGVLLWPDCLGAGRAFPKEITGIGAVCMVFLLVENIIKLKGLKREESEEESTTTREWARV